MSHAAAVCRVGCRVEPVVAQPAPPQTRTCAIYASGSSGTRASARLWCRTIAALQVNSDVVHDPGCGQRQHGAELGERLPTNRSRPPTPAQPIPPRALDAPIERFQLPIVPTNTVVLVVPAELLAQRSVLRPNRVVPMRAAPLPHRPHRAPQPLPGRPP